MERETRSISRTAFWLGLVLGAAVLLAGMWSIKQARLPRGFALLLEMMVVGLTMAVGTWCWRKGTRGIS